MARVTKKWCKEFAKRYTDALNQIRSLDKEIKEVRDNNPDEWFYITKELWQAKLKEWEINDSN